MVKLAREALAGADVKGGQELLVQGANHVEVELHRRHELRQSLGVDGTDAVAIRVFGAVAVHRCWELRIAAAVQLELGLAVDADETTGRRGALRVDQFGRLYGIFAAHPRLIRHGGGRAGSSSAVWAHHVGVWWLRLRLQLRLQRQRLACGHHCCLCPVSYSLYCLASNCALASPRLTYGVVYHARTRSCRSLCGYLLGPHKYWWLCLSVAA